ncbi:MAG TPA: hypothetical protein DCE42_13665 [Myxococcales bacterium]|nr:hypothetical protein [Deltaproteobacteria bacterium]MBU54288.1 hypothetical protein [Deltaproteobacteria bacterium]HAA55804.1 hypothetical protein [Myxococcales bacterium]
MTPRISLPSVFLLCALLSGILTGCQARPLTEQITTREGPLLNYGRMSSSLGTVKLKDGRVVVIGGSPTETPFAPLTGTKSIEILNAQHTQWTASGINVTVPLSGAAFLLPDGRILAFSAVYAFNKESSSPTDPPDSKEPSSGAVSAVIIDIDNKRVTPLYRPILNDPKNPPLQANDGPAFVQRAFARSIQLKDGRIIRIGGRVLYLPANHTATCKQPDGQSEKRCRYCAGDECKAHPTQDYACTEVSQCPSWSPSAQQLYLPLIEIYTPPGHPDAKTLLGSIQRINMLEGRRHTAAIELNDGRVLITGGQGPQGDGAEEVFSSTYFLDPKGLKIGQGPRMRVHREDHGIAQLQDGRILISGGTDGDGQTVSDTELFDPKLNIFLNGDVMNLTREDHYSIQLGSWLFLFGGEVSSKADQIRNSAEIFDAAQGYHIGSFFLFSRKETDANQCPEGTERGVAGIDDFAAIALTQTSALLLGGQQGCQDRDGEYISPGQGSRRTLFVELPPSP